ncbi:ribosome small subunit-dependent GTPase [Vallitalea longa]|uniref:Small ribosomal subunit biogenesis GTPase RsgA n=1 Tax=Vallitalea longa TaxID=2936439 RepID=A0A9W5Y769_9FIRM|nr:ribosome small subunit-dependent GTPase A [Vallitalea longa]GKX27820.1 ribosome small subunit-dependent GTPase [Vallitalea longa]
MIINDYGWNEELEQSFTTYYSKGLIPARILVEHRGIYRVVTQYGELEGFNSGKLYYEASKDLLPTVGDWVAVTPVNGEEKAIIKKVLPRKSKFIRKIAGNTTEGQVVATNFDYVFIVTSLNNNFNVKRLERYLTVAWDSGAEPVIILSKADLCDNVNDRLAEVQNISFGVNVHVISSISGTGIHEIKKYFSEGKTSVVLGSSGVGKSTLINTLLGEEVMMVNEAREDDDRGRHTTTHRELIILKDGGMIIDTPGMREIGLWSEGEDENVLTDTFSEINALSENCRFRDCTHTNEPGCAVLNAIKSGELDEERLKSYKKLKRELIFIESKKNAKLKLEEKRKMKAKFKQYRNR